MDESFLPGVVLYNCLHWSKAVEGPLQLQASVLAVHSYP